jgi:hypothetical protein
MVSDPNAEQNNTNDGNNIQNVVSLPVNITSASATNNDTNCRNDDSDRSSESCNDTSAAVCSGSRCTRRRTSGREDMVSVREEEDLQSACQHCIHWKRRQERREHLNNALNELRSSLNVAFSTPLLPEHFLSVGNESFRRLVAEVAAPVDLINRVDGEDSKANPLKEATRVELVNQASTIIREISRDNMRLRQEIGEMIAGRQTSLSWEQQSESDSASY